MSAFLKRGAKGKKYMSKPFKELLLKNSNKKFSTQEKLIESEITEWMSSSEKKYNQTDDMCIVGIKMP